MLTAWHNEVSLLSSTVQSVAFDTSIPWEIFLSTVFLKLGVLSPSFLTFTLQRSFRFSLFILWLQHASYNTSTFTDFLIGSMMHEAGTQPDGGSEGRKKHTHTPRHVYREAGIRLSGVCSPWSSSTNYITILNLTQSVDSVQQRREQAVLRGQCREAVSGWRHPGGGAGVSSFAYTRQLLVNTGYWTRGGFASFLWTSPGEKLCQFPRVWRVGILDMVASMSTAHIHSGLHTLLS